MMQRMSTAHWPRARRWIASAAIHALGATCYFTAFTALFVNEQILKLIRIGVFDAQMQAGVLVELALMLGLACCAWALTAIVATLFRMRVREASPRGVTKLRAARGTVLTETLIILPIFFLLTFGLAQMAINSMAGLLTQLASYEVARTLAVWAPEEGNRANRAQIQERARVVAAGVIAPVVPMFASGLCNQQGESLQAMRRGLTGTGLSEGFTGEVKWSFGDGFDRSAFRDRGPTKLTLAYCNIEISWTGPETTATDNVRTSPVTGRVQYHHPVSMPLIGPIFASDPGAGLWATEYVSTFDKSYMLYSYLTPNIHQPYRDPNYWWDGVQ